MYELKVLTTCEPSIVYMPYKLLGKCRRVIAQKKRVMVVS